jgi:hypothetical protein
MDFRQFPTIRNYTGTCIITEKIDGTNACIGVEDGLILAGSRNRWLNPAQDNFGFAAWVAANEFNLTALPNGRWYGEWWGAGIQRRYNKKEKYFTPFSDKFIDYASATMTNIYPLPVIYAGRYSDEVLYETLMRLEATGSRLDANTPSEGVVVYFSKDRSGFKAKLENVICFHDGKINWKVFNEE